MFITSPPGDHAVCDAYATFFADVLGKHYSHAYAGARLEMAFGRYFGISTIVATHLARVKLRLPEDYTHDMVFMGRKLDSKVICSAIDGLMITQGRLFPDVAYLLGNCTTAFPSRGDQPRTLVFEFLGWEAGDPARFCDHPTEPNKIVRDRSMLRTLNQLAGYLRGESLA